MAAEPHLSESPDSPRLPERHDIVYRSRACVCSDKKQRTDLAMLFSKVYSLKLAPNEQTLVAELII